MAFNGLTDAQAERLALLSEELGEVLQALGKIQRHGYESYHPAHPEGPTNRQQLEDELGDLLFAITLMDHEQDIDMGRLRNRVAHKSKNIWKYLHHNTEPS